MQQPFFSVRISPQLLESMTLAAVEAYCYGKRHKGKWNPVETLGYVWGFKKQEEERTVFYLDRTSLSISSSRDSGSVLPNQEAAILKNEVVMRWSPHLTMLGDFHSHAYRTLTQVQKIVGFEFSKDDFESFLGDDMMWKLSGNTPVMLAITVCRLGRVGESIGDRLRNNIYRYAVGEFQFWINVAVGYVDENGFRHHTGNSHSHADLDIDYWHYNAARDRVQQP
jgi:hypothetical protein